MTWNKARPVNYQGGRGRNPIEGHFGKVFVNEIPLDLSIKGVEITRPDDVDIDADEYVMWKYKDQSPVILTKDGFYYDGEDYVGPDPNQQAFLVLRMLSGKGYVSNWREKKQ